MHPWKSPAGRVPFLSGLLVMLLLVASVMVIGLLVGRLALLQVAGVMRFIGQKGRQVISEVYPLLISAQAERREPEDLPKSLSPNLPVTQTVIHAGEPMPIAAYNHQALVTLARRTEGLIVMPLAVGDIVIEGQTLLTVHGGHAVLPQSALRRAVNMDRQRTFE